MAASPSTAPPCLRCHRTRILVPKSKPHQLACPLPPAPHALTGAGLGAQPFYSLQLTGLWEGFEGTNKGGQQISAVLSEPTEAASTSYKAQGALGPCFPGDRACRSDRVYLVLPSKQKITRSHRPLQLHSSTRIPAGVPFPICCFNRAEPGCPPPLPYPADVLFTLLGLRHPWTPRAPVRTASA